MVIEDKYYLKESNNNPIETDNQPEVKDQFFVTQSQGLDDPDDSRSNSEKVLKKNKNKEGNDINDFGLFTKSKSISVMDE